MSEQKPKKRFVSPWQYAQNQTDRAITAGMGGCIGVLACVAGMVSLILLLGLIYEITVGEIMNMSIVLAFLLFTSMCTFGLYYASRGLLTDARTFDPGIPLTRNNAQHLPADQSLVRASDEPVEQQQTVLLRASEEEQISPDELVRPVQSLQSSQSFQPAQPDHSGQTDEPPMYTVQQDQSGNGEQNELRSGLG